VVFVDKYFRNKISSLSIFKIITRKSGLISLAKEKLHQFFTGAVPREKILKKIQEGYELSEIDHIELEKITDISEQIVCRLGGGKRSGKEWEGMAKCLKYIFNWLKLN
jgi:hypothetical protein